jgi:hypothetical protein
VLEFFLKRLSTRPSSAIRFGLQPKYFRSYGSVECEPWFTGSREKCELGNNVNHKNIDKKNSRTGPVNQIMKTKHTREPNLCEPKRNVFNEKSYVQLCF